MVYRHRCCWCYLISLELHILKVVCNIAAVFINHTVDNAFAVCAVSPEVLCGVVVDVVPHLPLVELRFCEIRCCGYKLIETLSKVAECVKVVGIGYITPSVIVAVDSHINLRIIGRCERLRIGEIVVFVFPRIIISTVELGIAVCITVEPCTKRLGIEPCRLHIRARSAIYRLCLCRQCVGINSLHNKVKGVSGTACLRVIGYGGHIVRYPVTLTGDEFACVAQCHQFSVCHRLYVLHIVGEPLGEVGDSSGYLIPQFVE